MRTRIPLAIGTLLTVLSLAACGATAEKKPTTAPSAKAEKPAPVVTTEPVDETTPVPSADPTCETLITEGTVEALTSQGWTAKQEEFRIGDTVFTDGLLCLWSDFTQPSDHGQMYAWAPIDEATADTAQDTLLQEGWLRSEENGSIYLTEDPASAIATDEDGFGMTYEFGDGWVKLADTKQSLVLIDWR